MEDTTNKRINRRQQLLYIVAPLFLLIVCLSTINLAPALVMAPAVNQSIQTPVVASVTTTVLESPAAAVSVSQPAQKAAVTPASLPTGTPDPLPSLPAGAQVRLLGPPPNSAFRVDDTLSFYWQWPAPLKSDQTLALYLFVSDQELLLGRLAEPNVGTTYWLPVLVADITGVADTVGWQVRLESTFSKEWLAASEVRPLILLAKPQSSP